MRAELRRHLADALGEPVRSACPLSGGDICEAWLVHLSSGELVFVKSHPQPPPTMFPAEARGLRWLAARGPLPTPGVRAVSPSFLALSYIVPAGVPIDAGRLGEGLAALHCSHQPAFGLEQDNFLGRLPQQNAPALDWASFYRDRRLAPLMARAELPVSLRSRLDRLLDRLPERVGPPEPPSPLHGDLWSGNVLVGVDGQPWLIDPAAHAGHRELDLAMMRLFGGFPERTFDAYRSAYPLSVGWEDRVPLWQLYYLLAHVCLFGRGWWGGVGSALDELRIR